MKITRFTPLEIRRLPKGKLSLTGFTLLELVVVVVIISILVSLAVPIYRKAVRKAKDRDAQGMLMLVQQAEKVYREETGSYVNCTSAFDCSNILRLNLPSGSWAYSASDADENDFCAQAQGVDIGTADCWYINAASAEVSTKVSPCCP
ncbi:MAG: prepilin-type N-terminal cleavage/methylation domain-containing protein [Candidatus Omnitrophica bacterium]|nr:prepilin-type N-terminal cleavage/methylation domain-containing protein [Candidatus Omnitrophota bacterium]MBU1524121.1 prepilin-type N-terminal cleavage/methylation domain-containing protein [Candidatus Omnitrophota bacterium]MBU2437396.1 prepilin-type N-terminal cleavage/methylation domain-containing protein [Candidatus Omnitrophota bacterium]